MSNSKPTPVVIVKPEHSIWYNLGATLGLIGGTFLSALIAWWLGPFVLGDIYTLGYWQTFALLFFVRCVLPSNVWPFQSRKASDPK